MQKSLRILSIVLFSFLLVSCKNKSSDNRGKNEPTDTKSAHAIKNIPQVTTSYRHEVMVLGSFHFNRSTDGSDVVAKNQIDITTEKSQAEIEEIVSNIVTHFKPSKVAIEWMPRKQGQIDSLYQAYQQGSWELSKNEAFQIGFRVAKRMGLSGIRCVDNRPPQPKSIHQIDDWEAYAKSLDQEIHLTEYNPDNKRFNQYMDDMLAQLSLNEYLRLVNSPEHLKRYKELSLTGLVNLGYGDSYVGADLSGNWYRRNTRIFVNVRNLCETQNERILVIYGAAHKWILDELFEGSPEFKLVQPFHNL